MKTCLVVLFFVYFVLQCVSSLGPLHASCKIKWSFDVNCTTVNMAIVNQIKAWTGDKNCEGGGEKCLYKLLTSSPTKVTATHETPKQHYIDDLDFTFDAASPGKCDVNGHSTSETWYAVLDYGTNYCNLHNLITGSGLNKQPGYKETTSNDVCTQYSSANCEKY